MSTQRPAPLCNYTYDPLDRLSASTETTQATAQRFYCKDRLATELQGAVQHSIMQHDDQLLAQQQHQTGTVQTRLLATDQQRSVLNLLDATQPHPIAYMPYGHRPAKNGLLSLLGFNGERPDPVTGHYLLGNGYRAFNPVLMRFNSPDSWSPFGEGGLNAYAYCVGDPVNRIDPTGHSHWFSLMQKHFPRAVAVVSKSKQIDILGTSRSAPKTLLEARSSTAPTTLKPTKISNTSKTKLNNNSITHNFKKNKKQQPPLQTNTTPETQNEWTYSKGSASFSKSGLSKAAQEKFDTFQNAIYNSGLSHLDAARLAGDSNPKKIQQSKVEIFQIRLSQGERVMYSVEGKNVIIRQVGGHT